MENLRAAIIGYGGRGHGFEAAINATKGIDLVSISEPKENALNNVDIKEEFKFKSYDDFFAKGKIADIVFITTPDFLHVDPCLKAIETGYKFIVLEKPLAPTPEECISLEKAATENNAEILVCHSLRYDKHYLKIKEIIDSKVLGDIYNIHQIEGVGNFHFTHSFVRGAYSNSTRNTFMLLQKCCHDIDLIAYLCSAKYSEVSSFGELSHFNSRHAPEGSAKRCIDCSIKDQCRYDATREYLGAQKSFYNAVMRNITGEKINDTFEEAMAEGPYGRCVYHCDNDSVDHQVVNFRLDNGATGTLTMTAFDSGRRTLIQGTKATLNANHWFNTITVEDHYTHDITEYKLKTIKEINELSHSRTDLEIVKEIIAAAKGQRKPRTNISGSVHSHLACFAAEKSRLEGKNIKL